jgi:hypothetical protein
MNVKYIVLRDGIRVSYDMHNTQAEAEVEANHWREIIKRWPDGTKVVVKKIGE